MERSKIKNFYEQEIEVDRLELEAFKLEGIRTKEIIERYIQTNNLEILDIGGGAGYYSFWLQEKGHNVTLVDLSPKNIELIKKHAEATGRNLKKFETGDAVNLGFSNEQFDVVLLLGPLYHLIDRSERIMALSDAKRVLNLKVYCYVPLFHVMLLSLMLFKGNWWWMINFSTCLQMI